MMMIDETVGVLLCVGGAIGEFPSSSGVVGASCTPDEAVGELSPSSSLFSR